MIQGNINNLLGKLHSAGDRLPFFVTWELTYRCQNRCVHCYQMEMEKVNSEVCTSDVIQTLNELKNGGTLHVTFSGGDPFIRSDFMYILEESRRIGLDVSVFTSGQQIDEEKASILSRINVSTVEVTFLGSDANMHNKLAGNKFSFERLTNTITVLNTYGVKIIAKYVLMKDNYNQLEEFINLCAKYHIAYKIDNTLYDPWNANGIIKHLQLSDEQIYDYICNFVDIRPRDKGPVMCNAGYLQAGITPTGDIVPCNVYGNKVVFGNIKSISFKEAWYGPQAIWFRENYKNGYIVKKECGVCECKEYCNLCHGFGYALEKGQYQHICKMSMIKKKIYEKNENITSI